MTIDCAFVIIHVHCTDCLVTELEKCRDDLKHSYLKNINQKKSTRWPKLGDPTLYVDVTVVRAKILSKEFREQHAMGLVKRKDYSYITVDELLKDGYGKRNLIEGDPGAGKTTFTFQICKEWAEGKLLMEDVVFWIPLRHYKSVTTISQLFDVLGYPEILGYAQQYSGKGLVLILDGWDELPNHLQTASVFRDFIFGSIRTFTHSTIIVTSRPNCSSEIAEAVEETDSYYQILGFDQEMAVKCINAYFHDDPPCAKLLLDLLNSNQYLHQHFYIPISVAIMCFVYHSDGEHIPQTLCQLYKRFVLLCLRSHVPDVCRQDLAKFKSIQNLPKRMKPIFDKLCSLAFDMLKDNKLVLNEEEIEVMRDDLDSLQLKQFDGFGLLHVDHYTSSLATMETSYSFIHRSIQELLAAIFISNTGNVSDLLDKYFNKHSYLINVFPFLFTLMSKEFLRPLAEKLIQIFNKSNRSGRLLSSILYCLFEAHDETLCHEFGQVFSEDRNFRVILQTFLDWHRACYFISVCGVKRLNVTIDDSMFVESCDIQSEILCKYLQSTSTDIASFHYFGNLKQFSSKGMEHFAKALSTQYDLLSVKLSRIKCPPGCITILCGSIRKHNPHITELKLPDGELSKNDLESIGLLLTTCLSFEVLIMNCSPSKGVCLGLSLSFCKALCETKSLQKLLLHNWTSSQANSEVFGKTISENRSLKEFRVKVATADCLDPILKGLSSNTSITTFRAWPSEVGTSNALGQCLKECLTLNHSLNIMDFTSLIHLSPLYILWSSTQVSSICTGLCTNTTVVTLDISGCYIDTEACHSVCGMLSQNTTLKHLCLNPVHLEKQDAIAMIDSSRTNNTLELLSLVQWPPKLPFQYSHDPEITHILQQIQPHLNVYWLVTIYDCVIDVLLSIIVCLGNMMRIRKLRNIVEYNYISNVCNYHIGTVGCKHACIVYV